LRAVTRNEEYRMGHHLAEFLRCAGVGRAHDGAYRTVSAVAHSVRTPLLHEQGDFLVEHHVIHTQILKFT